MQKTIEQLEADNLELQEENKILLAVNKDLTLEIEALKAAPAEPLAHGLVNSLSFEHDGITYGFAIPGVNLDGKVITAAEVAASKELQAELIERQSGMITVIA